MKRAFISLLCLIIFWHTLVSALTAGPERHFQVEMLAPGHFRIRPNHTGPISSALVGGSQSKVITHQGNGRTFIYVNIQPGAVLKLKVGHHQLHLRMIDSNNYETRED